MNVTLGGYHGDKTELLVEAGEVDLDDFDLTCCQLIDEIGPGHAGDLRGPALRDDTSSVPVDRRCQADFAGDLPGRTSQGGEDGVGELDGQ